MVLSNYFRATLYKVWTYVKLFFIVDIYVVFFLLIFSTAGCSEEPVTPTSPIDTVQVIEPRDTIQVDKLLTGEYVYLLEEGNWQSDNGQMSFLTDYKINRDYFAQVNGFKIGDTPQDILYLPAQQLIVISVNWSNIVYWCDINLNVIAQTEDVPNCRSLCSDGTYVYITSYAHYSSLGETFTGGYVAKIDIASKQLVSTCEVGYEPEGVAYYNGKLFIANTGGYAFSEGHEYEHSISVVDAESMVLEQTVDILNELGEYVINLYGEMSQSGEYLCINSPGDYYDVPASTVIFNCESLTYKVYDNVPATYNTTLISGKFFVIGSYFSYNDGEFIYSTAIIDPRTKECISGYCEFPEGFLSSRPDSLMRTMQNPYCVYQNPYTGVIYMVDATTYASPGKVFTFDVDGSIRKFGNLNYRDCYINAGHMLALNPNLFNNEENN